MNRNRRILLVVIVAALLATTSAQVPALVAGMTWRSAAAPAPDAEPVPGGPAFQMVSPFEFRLIDSGGAWAYYGGGLYNPGPGGAFYAAALTLPNNITITKMVVYFYDNSAINLYVTLLRCYTAGLGVDTMAYVASSGTRDTFGNEADESIDYPVVDQQSYSYSIEVSMPPGGGSDLRLIGVRIDYAYNTGLPLVLNDE